MGCSLKAKTYTQDISLVDHMSPHPVQNVVLERSVHNALLELKAGPIWPSHEIQGRKRCWKVDRQIRVQNFSAKHDVLA